MTQFVAPEEWVNTHLGQIIQPSKERFDPAVNKNTTFIGLEHIESNTGRILKSGKSKSMGSIKTVFHSGDVLYGRLRPYLNKVCVPNFDGVCSTDILVFSKSPFVSNKYIALFLSTPNFVAYANQNATGVQHPRISFKKIEEFQIPLPPLSEQKRIASQVESLFSRINATKQSLEATLSLLEQHRQSVLDYAFKGRLAQHESDEQSLYLRHANTHLGQIIQPSKERFDPAVNKNTTFIGLEHIESNTGRILKSGKSKSMGSIKTVFHSGDVLYGRLRPYLNKVCVPNFDGVCSTDILVFSKSPFVSNKYIALFLSTPNFVAYANQNATGVQHPRISFKKIEEFQIPLPPLSEQKRIASQVESLFSRINATKQSLEATLSLLEQHRQSVLDYAFKGRLAQRQREARR